MAITKDLLIGIDEFRYYTGMSKSLTAELLTPLIIQATDLASQNVLGTALMIKLRTDYNASSLANKYLTLYDSDESSVLKMIIWQTYVMALPRLLYKIGAATISVGDTDEVTSVDSDTLSGMQRTAEASMVFYENQVKTYLHNNYPDFPELIDSTPSYVPVNVETVYTSQGTTYSVNKFYEI
jgi:hypothetical protein